MVNVGGSFGPIIAGTLRAISWNYAFFAAAVAIVVMLLITVFFYEEPPREIEGTTLGQKLRDIGTALSDLKFAAFLVLLGLFFWLPFWAFFNLCALYVDRDHRHGPALLDARRASSDGLRRLPLARGRRTGSRRILGETISHTGYIIMLLQVFVSRYPREV